MENSGDHTVSSESAPSFNGGEMQPEVPQNSGQESFEESDGCESNYNDQIIRDLGIHDTPQTGWMPPSRYVCRKLQLFHPR
jgi:hypothetical protein